MTPGEVILGVCPDCAHLHFDQPFPEVCPGCGTAKPPMSPDLAADRHQAMKSGLPLDPIIVQPDKHTPAYQRFYEGVQMLRVFLEDEVETLHAIEAELADAPPVPKGPDRVRFRKLELEKDGVEARCYQLSEINRCISQLVFAEDANKPPPNLRRAMRGDPVEATNAEDPAGPFPSGIDEPCPNCHAWQLRETVAMPGGSRTIGCKGCGAYWDLTAGPAGNKIQEGGPCPMVRCNGTLSKHLGTGPKDHYFQCGMCGSVVQSVTPRTVKTPGSIIQPSAGAHHFFEPASEPDFDKWE